MEEVKNNLEDLLKKEPVKLIFSNGKATEYKKIVIERQQNSYQAEKFTEKQAFHENIEASKLLEYCLKLMESGFKQLNAWDESNEYEIKLSKKGKVFIRESKSKGKVKLKQENNRKKNYYLEEGLIIPPLVDMGVISQDGKIINSMYDKYKQINKFLEKLIKEFSLSPTLYNLLIRGK